MALPEAWKILGELDAGRRRVCAPQTEGAWIVDEEAKRAILTVFRESSNHVAGSVESPSFDKIPLKFKGWSQADFERAQIRVIPGAVVRYGAFLAPDTVVMNAFVNVGAYVGKGTMIDSFVCVGSCAQVGAHCHIASHVVLGGVLEPAHAQPVIIEDDCFIGAHAAVVEGVHVRRGAVLGMGVRLGASTKIIDRTTGEVFKGEVPEDAVVVPGTYAAEPSSALAQSCAVIVRYGRSQQNTSLNEDLRR